MKNNALKTKIIASIAFVFVLIFGLYFTNAWFTSTPEPTNVVVIIGSLDADLIDGNNNVLETFNWPLGSDFVLKAGSYNQVVKARNNETSSTSSLYARIQLKLVIDGVADTSQSYITPNGTSWTYSNGWYKCPTAIAANSSNQFCTGFTTTNAIPGGSVVKLFIILEVSSSAF